MTEEHKYDIYLSYRDDDEEESRVKAWVQEWLLDKLEGIGLRLYIHSRDAHSGRYKVENISDAINDSRYVFVVLTPKWLAGEYAKFEAVLAHPSNKLILLQLTKCDDEALSPIIKKLEISDFSTISPSAQEEKLRIILDHIGLGKGKLWPSNKSIVISITPKGPQAPSQHLWELGYNGTLGKLFIDDVRNEDPVEAYIVSHRRSGSIDAWLNFRRIKKSSLIKIGWMTRFEVQNYRKLKFSSLSSGSKVELMPKLVPTEDSNVAKFEFDYPLPDSDQLTTLAEFLQNHTLNGNGGNLPLEWLNAIFDNLDRLRATKQQSEPDAKVIYSQYYSSRLPDFILHAEEIDAKSRSLTIAESFFGVHSFRTKSRKTVGLIEPNENDAKQFTETEGSTFRRSFNALLERDGSHFIFRLRGNDKVGSSLQKCVVVPATDDIAMELVDIVHPNGGEIEFIYDPKREVAQRRDFRLEKIFDNALKEYDKIKNRTQPWKNFGKVISRETPCGIAHGNLNAKDILIVRPINSEGYSETSKTLTLDYRYLDDHYPLNKDHASLEASIWYDVVFHQLDDLSEIGRIFVKMLSISRLFQFDENILDGQPLLKIIATIRQRAWRLYSDISLAQNWFPQYLELLYHELLILTEQNSFKDGTQSKSKIPRLIKLYFVLSLLNGLLDN